jgi:uncharacterized protein
MMSIALICGMLFVGLYWAALYAMQRSMLFPAPPLAGLAPRPADAQQIWLDVGEARVEAWFLPARNATGPVPLILYTHGNGELIDHWPDRFEAPRAWGMSVLLIEYPGYGRSSGIASEKSIVDTMLAAHDWALRAPGIDPARIIAFGRSLGGGAACALARRKPVAGLILESTFTSVSAFARGFYAPSIFVRDRFDNEAVVRDFKAPLLVIHGTHDTLIPVRHAHDLVAAAPHAQLELLACGHNDCERPWPRIREFLKQNALL